MKFLSLVLGSKSRKSQISHQTVALRDAKEKIQSHQLLMLNWLTDNGFSYKVMTSLNDLLAFVQKNAVDSDGNQKQLKGILTQTRNSFVQLISRLAISHKFEVVLSISLQQKIEEKLFL